jgi:hypothetical protein
MWKSFSRTQWVGGWCSAVAVVAAASVVGGVAMTVNAAELWLVACLAPPAVMLLVWRGAPPATVAELLHHVNRPSKDSR